MTEFKKELFENKIDGETLKYYETNLPYLAEHSSYKERQAIECEREVDAMKKAEYMMDHIGEEYEGTISGVMSFGVFVEIEFVAFIRTVCLEDESLLRLDSTGETR